MDTISSSVSSFKVPSTHPRTHHHIHRLKPPYPSSNLLPHPTISTTTGAATASATVSTKPNLSTSSHHKFTKHPLPSTSKPNPSPIQHHPTHRNAASGYAAALVDAAICSNSLEAVHRDVKRFSEWLQHNELLKGMMADPSVEEVVKGRVIKEVAEKAKFRWHVVALVKMLVAKNKSGLVVEVMKEFERIYKELNTSFKTMLCY